MKTYTGILAAILTAVALAGCSKDSSNPATPSQEVSFKNDIQPVIAANCLICHANNGPGTPYVVLQPDSAYVNLYNRTATENKAYKRVLPGNADSSLIYLKISMATPPSGARMPRNGTPLPDAQIALFKSWINAGAKNN